MKTFVLLAGIFISSTAFAEVGAIEVLSFDKSDGVLNFGIIKPANKRADAIVFDIVDIDMSRIDARDLARGDDVCFQAERNRRIGGRKVVYGTLRLAKDSAECAQEVAAQQ